MSLARRSISTWVSGSPKRALYSTSLGPCFVSIRPAKSTPRYGLPSAAMAEKVGAIRVSTALASSSGLRAGAGE